MRLSPKEAANFIKNPPTSLRVAVISGKDRSRVRERTECLNQTWFGCKDDGFNTTVLNEIEFEADPYRLEDALCAQSLMGGRRVVKLKWYTEKAGSETILMNLIKCHADGEFNPDCGFLIETGALAKDHKLSRFFEKHPHIFHLQIYEEETAQVLKEIREALTRDQINLTQDALMAFIDHLPKEYGIAQQEIERLCLYIGPGSQKTIERDEIETVLGATPDASFTKAALDAFGGRVGPCLISLKSRFSEGDSPVSSLFALADHLHKLIRFKQLIETGHTAKATMTSLGLFWKLEAEFNRQSRLWPMARLMMILPELASTELACRSTRSPDRILSERQFMGIALTAQRLGL
jgi:DNA polymerase III subunit delta